MSRYEPEPEPSDLSRPKIDVSRPHAARMYDYYLGGKDHFEADRLTAEKALQSWAAVRTGVRENRAFLGRAVRYLAEEAGIRQFLDIGTGLPSANNVHEVAQSIAPESRVVYVDNDPIVLAHAKALLTGTPEGRTAFIQADLREPEKILDHPTTHEVLDLDRPLALMLVAVLHFIPDSDEPQRIIRTLVDALPSGSYVVASHVTPEHDPESVHGLEKQYCSAGVPARTRSMDELAQLVFTGLELIDPGVEIVSEWRPTGIGPRPTAVEVSNYGGVARKP
ncbi:MAG: SAM-dependent methyltransferase [Actinoallomurus sp.]